MKRVRVDRVGEEHGDWTVLAYDGRHGSRSFWLCECKCGTKKTVPTIHLSQGTSRSCAACARARATIVKRRCRWCGREGVSKRARAPGQLVVTGGVCAACHTQARRVGCDGEGRPLANGPRRVTT